jgi:LPS-assembly protein
LQTPSGTYVLKLRTGLQTPSGTYVLKLRTGLQTPSGIYVLRFAGTLLMNVITHIAPQPNFLSTIVRLHQTIILLLVLCNSLTAYAEQDFALCKPFAKIAPQRPQLPPPEGDSIRLFADKGLVEEKLGTSTFSGDVLLQRADQILSTHIVAYDRNKDTVNAESDFIFWDNEFVISGSQMKLWPGNRGEMKKAEYWFLGRRARGHAEKIIKESKDILSFDQASYTTCAPDKEVWRLDASQLRVDSAKSRGTARHVMIRLLNIPVFYFPYLSFPIGDERQSGFLAPSFGGTDQTGPEFSIPYYFNLAPHYDATLTPRFMSDRGLLLKTEFRYLTQASDGNLNLEYLPYDRSKGERRTSLAFKHKGYLTERWATDLDINYASDDSYFEDLGNNLSIASITHLERRGDLFYYGNGWKGLGRLQTFQSLDQDPETRPYQRIPQLLFKTTLPKQNRNLNIGLQSEFVRFDRNTDVDLKPIGNRFDIQSVFSLPWRTSGTFVEPKLSLLYTHYDLDNVATDESTRHSRFLFRFSTDSGLFLERDVKLLGTDFVQTLEPRLFYRYTSFRDQSDIPIFDTAEYDFSFFQLFREDNFNGVDRVDDGHQITLGLTSRLLGSQTGIEHLRASLGQIYYFRDRRVTLPDEPVETDAYSSIIMELSAQFAKNWQASSSVRWDPDMRNTELSVLRMRYQPDSEQIFNFSYRLRDDSLEQTDMSFHWNLSRRWNVLGRWNFSLPSKKTLETFAGLEYQSCCWAVRWVGRRYLNDIEGENYLNGLFLQFHLKGLGGIGKKANAFLEESIPGYHDRF